MDAEPIDPKRFRPRWSELSEDKRRFEARRMEIYAAMVSDLDTYVGELVAYLLSASASSTTRSSCFTATGYRTLAERGVRVAADSGSPVVAGSAVFRPQGEGTRVSGLESWWTFVPGANWREPEGPGSSLEGREQQPVVHVAFEDAAAYAAWAGRSLPTEAQFELAALTSARKSSSGAHAANTWQGRFPIQNDPVDGYAGAAPVACYEPNALGLYDMIGNVWEWTATAYYPRHDFAAKAQHPDGYDPFQPGEPVAVVKGGSYLCAPEYCMRYRPQARVGQSRGLGASHIGFRTVRSP